MRIEKINSFNSALQHTCLVQNKSNCHSDDSKKNNIKNSPAENFQINDLKNLGSASFGLFFHGNREISHKEILKVINTYPPLSTAGYKGVVYKYSKNAKDYAIKVAKSKDYSFNNEANVLKRVPDNINCQQYIDYFQHPDTDYDILISTFINGEKRIPQNFTDFQELFNKLIELDKAEILHGDLNMQNFLYNDNGISLIDFGEGEIFKTGETYNDFIYPEFILKSNIVNLEHNGIPDCIKKWAHMNVDTKQCFSQYLTAKGEYYKNHINLLKEKGLNSEKVIDYEENYSQVLNNPTDEVIENEIRRIDCLYTFEHADTAVNYRNKPAAARRNWNLTIKKAENQLVFIDNTLKNPNLSNTEKKYFQYQKQIISEFYNKFSAWGNSTIKWLDSLSNKKDLSEFEKKFIQNRKKSMTLPPDLVQIVMENY